MMDSIMDRMEKAVKRNQRNGMCCPRCGSFLVAWSGIVDGRNNCEVWVCWECEYEGYHLEFMLV